MYLSPKLVVASPAPLETDSGRDWFALVTNRQAMLFGRDTLEMLTAKIHAEGHPALDAKFLLGSRTRPAPGHFLSSVSLREGDSAGVQLCRRRANELECTLEGLDGTDETTIRLEQGTYLITLSLFKGGRPTVTYFVLNNRGTELARCHMIGPLSKKKAESIVANPGANRKLIAPWEGTF